MNIPLKEPTSGARDANEKFSAADEQRTVNILFGTYADVLFVLLPFSVVALFKAWQSGLQTVLLSYDISVAAAVLGGLAVVKFIIGMMTDPRMLRYKERIVFLISGTVFLIFVPGLLFSVLIMLSDPVPDWVMFIQPLLLILGITAYSGAIASTNMLQEQARRDEGGARND